MVSSVKVIQWRLVYLLSNGIMPMIIFYVKRQQVLVCIPVIFVQRKFSQNLMGYNPKVILQHNISQKTDLITNHVLTVVSITFIQSRQRHKSRRRQRRIFIIQYLAHPRRVRIKKVLSHLWPARGCHGRCWSAHFLDSYHVKVAWNIPAMWKGSAATHVNTGPITAWQDTNNNRLPNKYHFSMSSLHHIFVSFTEMIIKNAKTLKRKSWQVIE